MSRRRTVFAVLVVAALALLGRRWLNRGEPSPDRLSAAPHERPRSAWVVARDRVPRLAPPRVAVPAIAATAGSGDATALSERLRVRAVDLTGGPIPGAQVVVAGDGDGGPALGGTDAEGWLVVELDRLNLPHSGHLAIGAAGYGRREVPYLVPAPVVVKLLPENRVAGVVVEAVTGAPVAGVTVQAGHAHTVSDAEGRFVLGDLPPGKLALEAHGRGYYGVPARPIALAIASVITDVRIEVGRTASSEDGGPKAAFTIRGRVTAAGRPLPRIEVRVGSREATTEQNGRYTVADVPAGTYSLQATTTFLNLSKARRVVVTDRDVEADLEVGPRVALLVEVVDGDGKPIARHEVSLKQGLADSFLTNSDLTDEAGRVRFEGLLPAQAQLGGRAIETRAIDLRRIGDRPVRLVAAATGRLEGRLRAPAGTSVGDRNVVAIHQATQIEQSVDSAADGGFSFGVVPDGVYTIEVRSGHAWSSAHRPSASAQVTVRAGATTQVSLEVAADDGVLGGRVIDARGNPVDDALVIYFRQGLRSFSAGSQALGGGIDAVVTGADGGFIFTGVRSEPPFEVEAHTRAGDRGKAQNVAGQDIVVPLDRPSRESADGHEVP